MGKVEYREHQVNGFPHTQWKWDIKIKGYIKSKLSLIFYHSIFSFQVLFSTHFFEEVPLSLI